MLGHKSRRTLERENEELRRHCMKLAAALRTLMHALDSADVMITEPDGRTHRHKLVGLPEMQESELSMLPASAGDRAAPEATIITSALEGAGHE
jgi:hypothetical protein